MARTGRPKTGKGYPTSIYLDPEAYEALTWLRASAIGGYNISQAVRDRVLSDARTLGWTPGAPLPADDDVTLEDL